MDILSIKQIKTIVELDLKYYKINYDGVEIYEHREHHSVEGYNKDFVKIRIVVTEKIAGDTYQFGEEFFAEPNKNMVRLAVQSLLTHRACQLEKMRQPETKQILQQNEKSDQENKGDKS